MNCRDRAQKLFHCIVVIGNPGLQLLWYFLQIIVSIWCSIQAMGNLLESYLISNGVLKKYKSLYLGKLKYLAVVIESEDAHQTSKVVKLLQWLDSIGVKNVCLYDMNGVLKKSKEAIFRKLKNAKPIEEVNEAVTHHAPYHMTLEFVSYVDGREAVAKAANLIFMDNSKRHNLGGEPDGQILLEPRLNGAIQIASSKGPEPDLLLVYGPVRSHLGFSAWRIRYTEIV
ncbi:Decaprenyl diphosphate synthase-like superfamily [Sesbania bispinosa]|nr:Decaprenyl diphosphate synthase-like superfamily [Sesbania bispinosa]